MAKASTLGLLAALGLLMAASVKPEPSWAQSAPQSGEALYEARCGGCHAIDRHQIGPSHRGVVGRRAGSIVGYSFSPALRRYGQVWTAALLDRWLANPRALVPGTRMGQMVRNPAERQAIIAYLTAQRATPPVRR